MAAAGRWRAGLALLAVTLGLCGTGAEQTEEHLKREHSLSKPYQGERGGRAVVAHGARCPLPVPGARCRCPVPTVRVGRRCGLGQLGAVGPAGQRHGHDPVHPPDPRRAEQAGSRVEPSGERGAPGRGSGAERNRDGPGERVGDRDPDGAAEWKGTGFGLGQAGTGTGMG